MILLIDKYIGNKMEENKINDYFSTVITDLITLNKKITTFDTLNKANLIDDFEYDDNLYEHLESITVSLYCLITLYKKQIYNLSRIDLNKKKIDVHPYDNKHLMSSSVETKNIHIINAEIKDGKMSGDIGINGIINKKITGKIVSGNIQNYTVVAPIKILKYENTIFINFLEKFSSSQTFKNNYPSLHSFLFDSDSNIRNYFAHPEPTENIKIILKHENNKTIIKRNLFDNEQNYDGILLVEGMIDDLIKMHKEFKSVIKKISIIDKYSNLKIQCIELLNDFKFNEHIITYDDVNMKFVIPTNNLIWYIKSSADTDNCLITTIYQNKCIIIDELNEYMNNDDVMIYKKLKDGVYDTKSENECNKIVDLYNNNIPDYIKNQLKQDKKYESIFDIFINTKDNTHINVNNYDYALKQYSKFDENKLVDFINVYTDTYHMIEQLIYFIFDYQFDVCTDSYKFNNLKFLENNAVINKLNPLNDIHISIVVNKMYNLLNTNSNNVFGDCINKIILLFDNYQNNINVTNIQRQSLQMANKIDNYDYGSLDIILSLCFQKNVELIFKISSSIIDGIKILNNNVNYHTYLNKFKM